MNEFNTNINSSIADGSDGLKRPPHCNADNSRNLPQDKRQRVEGSVVAPSMSPSRLDTRYANCTNNSNEDKSQQPLSSNHSPGVNHRPVTSCSHCRQHKIKCDASKTYPSPCSRCSKYDLHCEIDPKFRPKKGSQTQLMRKDIDDLKVKIEYLLNNQSILSRALNENEQGREILSKISNLQLPNFDNSNKTIDIKTEYNNNNNSNNNIPKNNNDSVNNSIHVDKIKCDTHVSDDKSSRISVQTYLVSEPPLLQPRRTPSSLAAQNMAMSYPPHSLSSEPHVNNNNNNVNNGSLKIVLNSNSSTQSPLLPPNEHNGNDNTLNKTKSPVIATTTTIAPLPSPHHIDDNNSKQIDEFVIGSVHISMAKAVELHHVFVTEYLPYLPIMFTNSAIELYSQSRLLFWTVMLTACLSDPEPTLYVELSSLIKQLAIETCWIRTPRSTHIPQALLILCLWPLPNQKVLDDCSYRFVNLAKSLSYQLGLHRGEFIWEFTRSQTSMVNAEKWRTRTWLGIFFVEICWSSILGLPPTSQTDYLVECAKTGAVAEDIDNVEVPHTEEKSNSKCTLPRRFKNLISLSSFQMKLCNTMGSSVISPDGLIGPKDRAGSLALLERELELINKDLDFEEDVVVHIYFLYVKLMVCCFAFLPDTPIEDQSHYMTKAYLCATKSITLLSHLLETKPLIALPIYIRQSISFSSLILFKLQLHPLMLNKYLNSARQSIVTVHRLFRNQLTAWATSVENDISRTASMLEKLNMVLIAHPEVFMEGIGIIPRIRSHLTGSLFYDLVWCVHEARRREMDPNYNNQKANEDKDDYSKRKLYPLPLYNHILKEDFKAVTQTTPNGTTVTTLVPTKNALKQAKEIAKSNSNSDGAIKDINGIPLSMLDETGSVKFDASLLVSKPFSWTPEEVRNPINILNVQTQSVDNTAINDTKLACKNNDQKLSQAMSPITMMRKLNNTQSLFAGKSNYAKSDISNFPPHSKFFNDNSSYDSLRDSNNITIGQTTSVSKTDSIPTVTNNEKATNNSEYNHLNNFFQQQSVGWTEGNLNTDDLFGWFDNMNMEPEF